MSIETILQAKNYREVVEWHLRGPSGQGRRKGVNTLATALRCHPTFVAKVLADRADFSMEQALAFAEYFSFPEFEGQFFIELVQHARSADQRTRKFFEARVETMRQSRLELSLRLGGKVQPSPEIQSEYYTSWIPQFIHIACQTEGKHTTKSLAAQMHLSEDIVEEAVRRLLRGGILRDEQGSLQSIVEFMHLPRQSHLIASLHQQWRLKVAGDVGRQKSSKAVHFSGLMSIDKACAEKIRELLTGAIAGIKPLVAAAPSKDVYFLGVDFYEPE